MFVLKNVPFLFKKFPDFFGYQKVYYDSFNSEE